MIGFDAVRERITEIMLITPEERMYADVLDLLLSVFDSEFGYFGYINSAGDLVCPSMTRHIFPACQVPDKDVVFPRAIWGGLWGRILLERRPLMKNAVHKVPIGHLPIGRSFGAPILYRGTLIGQLHFANRPSDYTDDDVALLVQTCEFIAPVLDARVRHDEQQRARAQLQRDLEIANDKLGEARDRLEHRVTERTAELEDRNRELEQFAYIASHDLQEPLRTVAGYLQLIERRYGDRLDAEGHEFIGFAVDGARRMQELIEALLAYSRVSSRERVLVAVSLDAVLDDTLQSLERAIVESAAIIRRGPLPVVQGDRIELGQLFQNLIGNAIKFCGDAPPEISIEATVAGDDHLVEVRDGGIGFDNRHAERVFLLFRRLQRKYPGTGIGLAICKKIVERHGGTIHASSIPGQGTTFRFTLPMGRNDQ